MAGNSAKIPPQSHEVEQEVLGTLLSDKNALMRVMELLEAGSFFNPKHARIYEAITELYKNNKPYDVIGVIEELKRMGGYDEKVDASYLVELTNKKRSTWNIEVHAQVLAEKAIKRKLIFVGKEISERAYSDGEDTFELLQETQQKLLELSIKKDRKKTTSISEEVFRTIEAYEKIHGAHKGLTGVPTGFDELDSLTGGFQDTDLVLIAARPSMGKTSLALQMARNYSKFRQEGSVGFISLEMSSRLLTTRLIAAEANINSNSILRGALNDIQIKQMNAAAAKVSNSRVFIDDTPRLKVLELRARATRMKIEHDIRILFVDYLQLLRGSGKYETREREVADISGSLKSLAKELCLPVVALCQLNRNVEDRKDKRPMLSDLRESGSLEADADDAIFIHRPEVYDKDDKPRIAEIAVAKQRNGATGIFELRFTKESTRFKNFNETDEPEFF